MSTTATEGPPAPKPATSLPEFEIRAARVRATTDTFKALALLARLLPEQVLVVEAQPRGSKFRLLTGANVQLVGPSGREYFFGPALDVAPYTRDDEDWLKAKAAADPTTWLWVNAPAKVDREAVAAKRKALAAAADRDEPSERPRAPAAGGGARRE